MKAACFTVAAMDYFPQRNEYFAGGNSLNQSIRFKDLCNETAFIGAVGTDDAGDRIYSLLLRKNVDVSHLYRIQGSTASNEIVNDSRGERFGVEGAWNNGVYGDFMLRESDWEFISDFDVWSTHANNPNYAEALRRKADKIFLAVDFLHFDTYDLLETGLNSIDIAYFGGTEKQCPDLLKFSEKFSGIIVLTLGGDGSVAFSRGKTYKQNALETDKVIDTTGCGDAFQASFTNEYFRSKNIEKALLEGASAGRKAAESFGGVPWI
ncbi:MAG TPA: PfkB family carbohydrate kinase [Spirochaetota bacterium]|nr:PfkB family carbohydrate kinase [Spirochaetota bacterium]